MHTTPKPFDLSRRSQLVARPTRPVWSGIGRRNSPLLSNVAMSALAASDETYPDHDYSFSQHTAFGRLLQHFRSWTLVRGEAWRRGSSRFVHDHRPLGFQVDTDKHDAFEVIRLVRSIKNSLAPHKQDPSVCRSWRHKFTSRPSMWTRLTTRTSKRPAPMTRFPG